MYSPEISLCRDGQEEPDIETTCLTLFYDLVSSVVEINSDTPTEKHLRLQDPFCLTGNYSRDTSHP